MAGPAEAGRPAGRPADECLVVALCWACDRPRYKRVPRRSRHHRHFAWSCPDCGVGWAGPGASVDADRPAARVR
ncbi:hypothetical protein [Amycolatopsis sp. lyj-23]|uniref:hypothetical protein n=1 Tax=Amycolatopsis sp. lyj-23 TaxID=2789283 RepID=UPI00397B0EC1